MSGRRSTFLDFARPEIGEEAIAAVAETLRSGWISGGPKVQALESALEQRLGGPAVRCTSSATAALWISLRLAGVATGADVLLPTMTFAACANVVELLGATPVFVDIDPATGLIDIDELSERVTPRTQAVIAVHHAGRPLNLDRLNELRDALHVVLVEDAAHAIGASWRERPIGAHGNFTAFSFHATKNVTTIEGGGLALADPGMAERVERLRLQGLSTSAWARHGSPRPAEYDMEEPGFKLAMNDVSAAIGLHELKQLDARSERRSELVARYDELLAGLPLECEPELPEHARHAHHLYSVRLERGVRIDRDAVIMGLRDRRIGSSVHFKPIHRLRYYRERYGLSDDQFPAAADYADRTLSLPLYPSLTESDQADVAAAMWDLLG